MVFVEFLSHWRAPCAHSWFLEGQVEAQRQALRTGMNEGTWSGGCGVFLKVNKIEFFFVTCQPRALKTT